MTTRRFGGVLAACVVLCLLPAAVARGQTSAPGRGSLSDFAPAHFLLQDASAADDERADDAAGSPPQPLPELPEVVVEGQPFPAQPLAADTVVTPTRSGSALGKVGSSVTVVDEAAIRASGRTNVGEVLRDVVGADVVQQGGLGGISSVFLRGTNSQHTKVLLDGIPINDPSNATRGFDFSTLDIENIERIEVLRGPQSLLYGSDAIGGVINIITRRGDGPLSLRSSSRGGWYGTWRQTATISGGDERRYYAIGGGFTSTDGISRAARRLGNTERDAYSNGTLSGRFGWTPSELVNVDYVFRWADVDAEVDDFDFGPGLPIDNLTRRNLSRTFYNRIQLQSLALDGAVEQVVGFNLADYRRDDTDPELFVPPEFKGQTRQVDWRANVLLARNNTLTVGADYLHEEAESSFVSPVSQHYAGLYVMDELQLLDIWSLTAGVRWDDHSQAGPANTYRVTNRIDVPGTGTALHGSIGTGFRAPALAENLFQFGNPDLRPERSKGWDVGCEQRFGDGRFVVDCTYFRNDLTDLIVFDFNTFRLENVGNARATGVELTGSWLLRSGTRLWANYTYTDTTNLDEDTQLLRRPRNKAAFGFRRRGWRDRASLDLSVLHVGPRLDTRSVILGDYTLLNLTATCDLTRHWTLFLHGSNLLDKQYEEINGYGSPGIALYGGVDFVW